MVGDLLTSSSATAGDTPKYLRKQIRDMEMDIQDEGRAFSSARSLSQVRWDRLHKQQSYAAVRQPLSSLGVGLMLSRLMMKVFKGDLYLSNNGSVISYGCTATLLIRTG
jgi:hypothetical protein